MEVGGEAALVAGAVWVVAAPRERVAEAAALAALAWDVPPVPGRIERILREPSSITMLALDARNPGGPLVGVATARLISRHLAVSEETVVHDEWRGHGVGRMLMAQMKMTLRAARVRVVRGQSSGTRLRELAFFVREGFRVIDCRIAKGQEWVPDGERIYETALVL